MAVEIPRAHEVNTALDPNFSLIKLPVDSAARKHTGRGCLEQGNSYRLLLVSAYVRITIQSPV